MTEANTASPVRILVVEDNPGDVLLTRKMLEKSRMPNVVDVVPDGASALAFLCRGGRYAGSERPDLILLDLNMPGLDGHGVLETVKSDETLKAIPVLMFSTSSTPDDVSGSYRRHANSYICKPKDAQGYATVMRSIEDFWLGVAELPQA